ncbi:MAG: hypothetical protein V1888_03285 [archaeon]
MRRLVGIIIVMFVVILFCIMFFVLRDEGVLEEDGENFSAPMESVVDWEKYNYDYVDEDVKRVLTSMISGGRTAFYLPSVGYINVTKGKKFGVAFALNNQEPSGENYFEYEWTVDDSVVENCGVSVAEAQGWIERGWMSFGKIPKGWVDHMTVYFSFPDDAPLCNVKYNFEIRKDGVVYDRKVVEFNIV